ncbi:MAG TPA: ACT domain-containing protein [Methylomirabilota bacterium]|nr:ACT domain-containing protein [Methylomirabilota bacterium]
MTKITQITVTAQSKPGVLAKIARAVADAGVNISAICAGETPGRGKLRMVVDDPERAKKALAAAKIRCAEEPALLLSVEDHPGALATLAEKLAAAKINIKCAYATTVIPGGGPCHVVVAVTNADKAEKALR